MALGEPPLFHSHEMAKKTVQVRNEDEGHATFTGTFFNAGVALGDL